MFASDTDLVKLLKQRPKHVPALRSREAFRRYFQGMPLDRMRRLLLAAYDSLDAAAQAEKTERRLALLDGLLA